jgi:hypothetical protein
LPAEAALFQMQSQMLGLRSERRSVADRLIPGGPAAPCLISVSFLDLAEIARHGVETMLARYTHSVGESFDAIRHAIG